MAFSQQVPSTEILCRIVDVKILNKYAFRQIIKNYLIK